MASRKNHLTTNKEVRPLESYEVKAMINRLKTPRDKALLAFLYLTGCRIEEVVKFIQEAQPRRTLTKKNNNKITKEPAPLKRQLIGLPIKKAQLDIRDTEIIIKGVRCLKRRNKDNSIKRSIPIVNNPQEEYFINVLREHTDKLEDEDLIFPITRSRAYQILDEVGAFPHLLRHTRATILATEYGFSDVQMQRFYGWADTRQTARYTHLNVTDILDKMKRK